MEFTGERFLPSCEGDIAAEHYHRYFFARQFAAGKDVLDMACGEGYGADILGQKAKSVTGVDISGEAVAHAVKTYARPNLAFLEGGADNIPLPDKSVDLVTSFETLEHVENQGKMLAEFARVLRPDGLLIISTPNRILYDAILVNEYHVHEMDLDEFLRYLGAAFANVALLGQNCMYGSLLTGNGGEATYLKWQPDGEKVEEMPLLEKSMYYVALASNAPLPRFGVSFFEYPQQLSYPALALKGDLSLLGEKLDTTRERLEEALLQVDERERAIDARARQIEELKAQIGAQAARIGELETLNQVLLQSRSWKITAPLRKLMALARKAGSAFRGN